MGEFTRFGALLNHQRRFHRQSGRAQVFCQYVDCERSSVLGFPRKEHLFRHILRVHGGNSQETARELQDPDVAKQPLTYGTSIGRHETNPFLPSQPPLQPYLPDSNNLTVASGPPNIDSDQDFWAARRPSHRPSSAGSCSSSSWNDSLHGSPKLDTTYQSPTFSDDFSENLSGANNRTRGLPTAPINWSPRNSNKCQGKVSFDCEICGDTINVKRKRDWQ